MILAAMLGIPLVGAALSWRASGRRATALHAVTAALTLAGALTVTVTVNRREPLVAFDGLLRADALSAWMIALIGIVGALAAGEAPRYVAPATSGRFYSLFHLFVFTMLLAVSTDDVGLMWVAVEGTTLASVFLVNFERTRASLEASYKYLLICSVGIAIAFLGTVLVYCSSSATRSTRCAGRRSCGSRPGSRRGSSSSRSCSSWSGTAPRPASRRCTPGCPTPTARRRRR
jgi:hydrogenase-4 component F